MLSLPWFTNKRCNSMAKCMGLVRKQQELPYKVKQCAGLVCKQQELPYKAKHLHETLAVIIPEQLRAGAEAILGRRTGKYHRFCENA